MERPGEVVSPKTFDECLLEELQLVGHATRSVGIFDGQLRRRRGGLGKRVRQRRTFKVLVQQRGLADAFARTAVLLHAAAGQPDQRAEAGGDGLIDEKGILIECVYIIWNLRSKGQN